MRYGHGEKLILCLMLPNWFLLFFRFAQRVIAEKSVQCCDAFKTMKASDSSSTIMRTFGFTILVVLHSSFASEWPNEDC
jgi:hypothetical protein